MKKIKFVFIFCAGILFGLLISTGIYKYDGMSNNAGQKLLTSYNDKQEPASGNDIEQDSMAGRWFDKWFEEEKIYLIAGPSSGFSETFIYIIEVLNNGLITTYYGLNKDEEIGLTGGDNEIELVTQRAAWLEEKDLDKIKEMLIDIKNSEKGEERGVLDSWEFRLCIGGEKYRRYYIDEEDRVMEFIMLLIELSPVDVDLCGFA